MVKYWIADSILNFSPQICQKISLTVCFRPLFRSKELIHIPSLAGFASDWQCSLSPGKGTEIRRLSISAIPHRRTTEVIWLISARRRHILGRAQDQFHSEENWACQFPLTPHYIFHSFPRTITGGIPLALIRSLNCLRSRVSTSLILFCCCSIAGCRAENRA